MKFVLTEEHLFWWPVKVRVPSAGTGAKRAGTFEEQSFEMQFRARTPEEQAEHQQRLAELATEAERTAHQDDFLRDVSCDWRGVTAADGSEVSFSEEMFEVFLKSPWNRIGAYRAYAEACGGQKARRGN